MWMKHNIMLSLKHNTEWKKRMRKGPIVRVPIAASWHLRGPAETESWFVSPFHTPEGETL